MILNLVGSNIGPSSGNIVEAPLIISNEHLINQVRDLVKKHSMPLDALTTNKVIKSISADLNTIQKELIIPSSHYPFDVLSNASDMDKENFPPPESPLKVSKGVPLVQSPFPKVSPLLSPRSRGRPPKHSKTQEEIDVGIQSTLISSPSLLSKRKKKPLTLQEGIDDNRTINLSSPGSVVRKKKKSLIIPSVTRSLANKRNLQNVFIEGRNSQIQEKMGASASPRSQ